MKKILLVFFIVFAIPNLLYSAEKKKKKPAVKQQKQEKKLELIDRIKLVLKYGNTAQVKDSLGKIRSLKEDQQRSLIPELRNLVSTNNDIGIQHSMIQLIGDVKWTDLDSEVIRFLRSEENSLIASAANVLRKKQVNGAIEPLKDIILKSDFTVENRNLNDLVNAYAGFKDPGLEDFMFTKLKDEKVLDVYKSFILKYLGVIPSVSGNIKEYLLNLCSNEKEKLGLRIGAVRALGNMPYEEAKVPFRKLLEGIESMSDLSKKKELFFLRLELISALVKLKDQNVKSLLIEMTRDDDGLGCP